MMLPTKFDVCTVQAEGQSHLFMYYPYFIYRGTNNGDLCDLDMVEEVCLDLVEQYETSTDVADPDAELKSFLSACKYFDLNFESYSLCKRIEGEHREIYIDWFHDDTEGFHFCFADEKHI